MAGERRYRRDEVEEILRRAASRSVDRDDPRHLEDSLHHDDLVAAAREAGLDRETVEREAYQLVHRRDADRVIERWREAQKRRFVSHATTFAIVQIGLALLDATTPGGWWFFYPLIGWGMGLALHGATALPAPTAEVVARVTRRERRRVAADARRDAKYAARELQTRIDRDARNAREVARAQRRAGVDEFERAASAGVGALLAAAARRLEGAVGADPSVAVDTEFRRYVAKHRGGKVAPPEGDPGAGPRVRVREPEFEPAEEELPATDFEPRRRKT